MARKTVKKSRTMKQNRKTVNLSESMENAFRMIPVKLPAQLNKEIKKLKKQESKLQAAFLKAQKKQTSAKNKHTALTAKAKNNLTNTLKKQITIAKKALEAVNQKASLAAAELQTIQQHGKMLSQKQEKFSLICNFIDSLDKKWEKKNAKAEKPAKAAKPAKVEKVKTRKKRKAAPSIVEEISVTPIQIEPVRTDVTPELVEAAGTKK